MVLSYNNSHNEPVGNKAFRGADFAHIKLSTNSRNSYTVIPLECYRMRFQTMKQSQFKMSDSLIENADDKNAPILFGLTSREMSLQWQRLMTHQYPKTSLVFADERSHKYCYSQKPGKSYSDLDESSQEYEYNAPKATTANTLSNLFLPLINQFSSPDYITVQFLDLEDTREPCCTLIVHSQSSGWSYMRNSKELHKERVTRWLRELEMQIEKYSGGAGSSITRRRSSVSTSIG